MAKECESLTFLGEVGRISHAVDLYYGNLSGESWELQLQASCGGSDSLSDQEDQSSGRRLQVGNVPCWNDCSFPLELPRSIAETHYQLGVAQAHCAEYANAEKSLAAAVAVLNTRIANLKKMATSDNIAKELAELTMLCTEIKERTADHKDMQKGTYKEDKDFVSIFKGMLVSFKQLLIHFWLRRWSARDWHQESCRHRID